jgi:hypothetical protein
VTVLRQEFSVSISRKQLPLTAEADFILFQDQNDVQVLKQASLRLCFLS